MTSKSINLATPTHIIEAYLAKRAPLCHISGSVLTAPMSYNCSNDNSTSTETDLNSLLASVCEDDNINRARALCTSTDVCDRLLNTACDSKAVKIIVMILRDFKHLLSKDTIEKMLGMDYVRMNLDVVNLFLNNLDALTLRPICINRFNVACNLGFDHTLKHLLQHCKHLILTEDFAFSVAEASSYPKIVELLYEAYGDALLDLYPEWTGFVKAKPSIDALNTCAV